jgi:outer membrane protein
MHKVARLLVFAGGLVLPGAIASPALAEMKIAVVDTQRAVMETEDGLRAQATLKKHFDKRQHELDEKQTALQKEREDIEKQKDVLSKQALQARIDKWQKDMSELQTVFVEYNKELQKKQGEMTQPIFQKTMGIIRRLATQSGYDLVVDKQAVPYNRSDLDLTDRVITEYNQVSGAAPAGPAPAGAKATPAPAAKKP